VPPDARVAAHVIVDDLTAASPALAADDARHLGSVLRLRPGEPVGATDGRGGYRPCVYAGSGRLTPAGPVEVFPTRIPVLTVGLVPVKGDRPEWAVQKLTELGVDRIVLLSSERSVVRWDDRRMAAHLGRLDRVARAALMQSRQVWLPEISGVVPVASVLGAPPGPGVADGMALAGMALADMGGSPIGAAVHTVVVGPEGGWTDAERGWAAGRVVGLGQAVLRAETAAVAAGVLLTALRAGLASPAAPAGVEARGPMGPAPAERS
jgi:16S rRNA (uracil1498-N3)-methyltransferase